jgi:hypothetical protein
MIIEFETRGASASDYEIDGELDPILTVIRGQTYVFQRDDAGHPLYIKSELGSGETGRYDDGVENNGSSDPGRDVTFYVPEDAPDTLFYQCGVHYQMNGRINVISAEASITTTAIVVEVLGPERVTHFDFSPGSNGHSVAVLIGSAFGSEYLDDYFGIGLSLMDGGMNLSQMADLVVESGLVEAVAGQSHTDWVTHVYENVTGVSAAPSIVSIFVEQLDSGAATKAGLLVAASALDSLGEQINLVGLQGDGLEYLPYSG